MRARRSKYDKAGEWGANFFMRFIALMFLIPIRIVGFFFTILADLFFTVRGKPKRRRRQRWW
jgi:lauroyl/myristoyl acyltransferase